MELKLLWQIKWVCMNGLPRIVSSMWWLLQTCYLVLLLFQFCSTRFMFSWSYLGSQRKQEPSWWQLVWPVAAVCLGTKRFPWGETCSAKSGRVLGKLGWAGHSSGSSSLHPCQESDCRLVPGSGGVASLAGPGEATVKDSGCFVVEWQVTGSVQFKAERQIWLRFMWQNKSRENPLPPTSARHCVAQNVYDFKSFQRRRINSFKGIYR